MSVRLNLVVEGQTEQAFIREVLAPHLAGFGVFATARRVETSRSRRHLGGGTHVQVFRGGMSGWPKVRRDIERWLKEDRGARLSTMFDVYALPDDFPGQEAARAEPDPLRRVTLLEAALADAIGDPRFVPYLQLHEFEALLLSLPESLADFFEIDPAKLAPLVAAVAAFPSPEHVDDHPRTAPSKRIIELVPAYAGAKATAGPVLASRIGLPHIRRHCRHFDAWLNTLESLP